MKEQIKELKADICICGGSLGGTLAAYSAASMGMRVILLEETDWIGGQLTSQAVPPDEHKWIEYQGCTASYRQYRNTVRDFYRAHPGFAREMAEKETFCPADSEVSYLSHPPKLALKILKGMLAPFEENGTLCVVLCASLLSCDCKDDVIHSVLYQVGDEKMRIFADMFLDGTDTGALIKASGTAYSVGAESAEETGEPHAPKTADPEDLQPVTYSACLENRKEGSYIIEKPALYDKLRALPMPYDKYPVFSMYGPDSSTGKAKRFGMFDGECDENGRPLFPLAKYRQIVCSHYFTDGSEPYDVFLVNWPQNDYFLGNLFDCENPKEQDYLARQLTLCFVYWLQTEAPRHDGGKGYPYFRLAGEHLGTEDGLSKAPYIRESRRIKGMFTVTESMLLTGQKPAFPDSVGVGSYPIDLHITTKSNRFLYVPSERFTIPLGAMIPKKTKNLIPACKNISTTHLTNGCYRLHPIEWNVGEAAGLLAAFAIKEGVLTKDVWQSPALFARFAALLEEKGIQRYWDETDTRISKKTRTKNQTFVR